MTFRTIVTYPDPVLLDPCREVMAGDDVATLCEDLKDTAKSTAAEGLAAPQIGSNLRVFVIRKDSEYLICINPEVLGNNGQKIDSREGCLSFPGVNETVTRIQNVLVGYTNEAGERVEENLTGVASVAFQHELDHLNGVLFTEHMGRIQRHMALKKAAKTQRQFSRQEKQLSAILKAR